MSARAKVNVSLSSRAAYVLFFLLNDQIRKGWEELGLDAGHLRMVANELTDAFVDAGVGFSLDGLEGEELHAARKASKALIERMFERKELVHRDRGAKPCAN